MTKGEVENLTGEGGAAAGLKRLRQRLNLSVRAFAKLLGMPDSTYSSYESSRYKRKFLPGELVEKLLSVVPQLGIHPDVVRMLGTPGGDFGQRAESEKFAFPIRTTGTTIAGRNFRKIKVAYAAAIGPDDGELGILIHALGGGAVILEFDEHALDLMKAAVEEAENYLRKLPVKRFKS